MVVTAEAVVEITEAVVTEEEGADAHNGAVGEEATAGDTKAEVGAAAGVPVALASRISRSLQTCGAIRM